MIIYLLLVTLLALPLQLSSMAQHKLNPPTSALPQRWNLSIKRPDNEEEIQKLLKDVQATLKSHYFSAAIDDSIIVHLKGSEETLLKKLEGKPWFDKSQLKKIETKH